MAFDTAAPDGACTLCADNPRYLGGNESLGRCICVTPEAMLALEEELRDERGLALLDRIGADDWPSVAQEVIDRGLALDHEDTANLLRGYLVSLGLPSDPAGATGNAALDKLIALVL